MPVKTSTRQRKTSAPVVLTETEVSNISINNIPGEEDIRNLAEVLYHQRIVHGEPGTAEEDWLQAENYLRSTDN